VDVDAPRRARHQRFEAFTTDANCCSTDSSTRRAFWGGGGAMGYSTAIATNNLVN